MKKVLLVFKILLLFETLLIGCYPAQQAPPLHEPMKQEETLE